MSAWHGTGRRVVVTGASSGIGAATAIEAARAGATVALVARRVDRLADVLAECRAHSPASQMVVADLSELDAIDGVATQLIDALGGGVDVLINNAGVPKRRGVADLTPEDVEGVMRINYFSPVRLTLALLPGMIERGDGDIVNVSSMGVHMAAFRVSAYSATKAALEMFTEGLHLELGGSGVRARVFIPGSTDSEFSTKKDGNDDPFPRDPKTVATSEQVGASLVASLADERFITYATERDAASSAMRNADPEAWLTNLRKVFSGM
jgi:short-subunit dehydrogenase